MNMAAQIHFISIYILKEGDPSVITDLQGALQIHLSIADGLVFNVMLGYLDKLVSLLAGMQTGN